MNMESGKSFLTRVEREEQEEEAIIRAREKAEKAGEPFGILDKEIARLEAKREKVAKTLRVSLDAPILQELDAQIERLKEEK